MPVDISLWGKPEHKHETVAQLERAGIWVKVTSDPEGGYLGSSAGPSSSSMMYGVVSNRRTFLTPSEVSVGRIDKNPKLLYPSISLQMVISDALKIALPKTLFCKNLVHCILGFLHKG